MKNKILFSFIFGLLAFAYFSAQEKLQKKFDVKALRLGMTAEQLEAVYGSPFAQNRNQVTYIFDDASELIVTFREDVVSSAQLKYKQPLKIEDPQIRQLTLVQMHSEVNFMERPTWFFAGKPEDGMIYKITSDGHVESLTWVPPFSYGTKQPKQLSALFRDFKSQQSGDGLN